MSDTDLVKRLSKAPWPAYVLAEVSIDGRVDEVVFGLPRKCASNTMKLAIESIASSCRYLTEPEMRATRCTFVSVVRYPFERVISVWRHAVIENRGHYIGLPGDMSLRDFVHHVCNTNDNVANYHFKQYSVELLDMTGRRPDEVLRCETLQYDLDRLCASSGWPSVELRNLNASTAVEHPGSFHVDEEARLAERYARDIENFYPESPYTYRG